MREQLREMSVQVIEVAPPLTRTTLMGSGADNERAMPLDEFLVETMNLLESHPDAQQILLEQCGRKHSAKAPRRSGTYRGFPLDTGD